MVYNFDSVNCCILKILDIMTLIIVINKEIRVMSQDTRRTFTKFTNRRKRKVGRFWSANLDRL